MPDGQIKDVIAALEPKDFGAFIVGTDGVRIEGLISGQDFVRGLQSSGPSVFNHTVRDPMSSASFRFAGNCAVYSSFGARRWVDSRFCSSVAWTCSKPSLLGSRA